jgi:hypothetical protein
LEALIQTLQTHRPITRRKTKKLLCLLLTVSITACAQGESNRQQNVSTLSDSWETAVPANFAYGSCSSVSQDLIVPVNTAKREKAIALLETKSFMALGEQTVAELVGQQKSTASQLINDGIAQLKAQRERAVTQKQGSWSGISQMRLDELEALNKRPSEMSAFLARAMVKNEATGMFAARLCADGLLVSHVSLGASATPSIRVPVLIFLDRTPANAYVATGMAR